MQCQSCHEKPESTCYCYDCKEKLCQNCYLVHQRVRITKDHQVQFFPNNNSARNNGTIKNPIQINSNINNKSQNGNNSPGSGSTPPLDPTQSSSSSASSVSSSSSHKPIGNGLSNSLSNSPDNMLGLTALNQAPQALVPNGAPFSNGLNLLSGHDGIIGSNGIGNAFNHSFGGVTGNPTTELISNK